jgi:hypothetical protein
VVTVDEFHKLYQTTYAFVVVYITCISATKISIMLFYRRMFGTGVIWYIVFALTICHWLEVTVTGLSGCRPVSHFWNQYTDPTAVGSCIDTSLFYFINGCIGLFIDVSILLVPLPTSQSPYPQTPPFCVLQQQLTPPRSRQTPHATHQKDLCRRHAPPRRLVSTIIPFPLPLKPTHHPLTNPVPPTASA